MTSILFSPFSLFLARHRVSCLPRSYIFVNKKDVPIGQHCSRSTNTNSSTTSAFNNVNIYHQYHIMQEHLINKTLTQYLPKLQRNKVSKMLDIGCGPGDITHKYLLPLVLENGTLLGIDKSENMIEYANSLYKGPKLFFELMDFSHPSIGEKYENTFELIFSFFCLHWIQDQKSAMKNIYKLLKPGGECLLLFVATWPFYEMYTILARSHRWYPYVKDYKNFISPYHQLANPVLDVRNRIQEAGLLIRDCVCTPITYVMPSEEIFYKSLETLDPFVDNIPPELIQDYLEDCKTIIWKENFCRLESTKEVTIFFTVITVHAYKLLQDSHFCNKNVYDK